MKNVSLNVWLPKKNQHIVQKNLLQMLQGALKIRPTFVIKFYDGFTSICVYIPDIMPLILHGLSSYEGALSACAISWLLRPVLVSSLTSIPPQPPPPPPPPQPAQPPLHPLAPPQQALSSPPYLHDEPMPMPQCHHIDPIAAAIFYSLLLPFITLKRYF